MALCPLENFSNVSFLNTRLIIHTVTLDENLFFFTYRKLTERDTQVIPRKGQKNRGVFNWIPDYLLADYYWGTHIPIFVHGHSLFYPVVPSRNGVIRLWWKPFRWDGLLFTCQPCDRMEASRQCCSFGSLKLFWILAAVLATGLSFEFPRQGRQRVEFIARTVTVAVTEVAFETIPTLCISLINATRPCVGRQAQWERIPAADLAEANVQPTVVQS